MKVGTKRMDHATYIFTRSIHVQARDLEELSIKVRRLAYDVSEVHRN